MQLELLTIGFFTLSVSAILFLQYQNRTVQEKNNAAMVDQIETIKLSATAARNTLSDYKVEVSDKISKLELYIVKQDQVNTEIAKTHAEITKTFRSVINEIDSNKNDIKSLGERDIIVSMLPSKEPIKMEVTNLNEQYRTVSKSRLVPTMHGKIRETISIQKPYKKNSVHPEIRKSKNIIRAMDL